MEIRIFENNNLIIGEVPNWIPDTRFLIWLDINGGAKFDIQ